MATYTISANLRQEMGRKNWKLREVGKVPAVVYGFEIEPQNLELNRNDFVKLYNTAGESSVIDLTVGDGKTISVIIQEFQRDPITGFVTHADFRAIDMTKPIEAEVKLIFEGESMAVKSMGGTLVRAIERLPIRALPKDLISSITVDLTKLVTFDDIIRVSDLALPAGVEANEEAGRTIALIMAPRSEEEMAALDEAVEGEVEEVEVEGEDKEGEEGAEAPAEGEKKEEEEKKEEKDSK